MVEAIVVMTMMLVFLGMILWTYSAYGGKLEQAAATRHSVLYFASHACEENLPSDGTATPPQGAIAETGTTTATEALRTGDQVGTADVALREQEVTQAKQIWNMAASESEKTISGSALVNLERKSFEQTLRTRSVVACNEKKYGGDGDDDYLGVLADFIVTEGKRKGGLASDVKP